MIYLTTHFSADHIKFLQNCWHESIEKSKLLQSADVLVFLTGRPANLTLLESIFFRNNVKVHKVPNPGYQGGAILAMNLGFEKKLFHGYDWVIRLNPDVIIHNDTTIIARILDPSLDGIFVNCKNDAMKLHTDWSAFRPSAVSFNETDVVQLGRPKNAENHFTYLMALILLEVGDLQCYRMHGQ